MEPRRPVALMENRLAFLEGPPDRTLDTFLQRLRSEAGEDTFAGALLSTLGDKTVA